MIETYGFKKEVLLGRREFYRVGYRMYKQFG